MCVQVHVCVYGSVCGYVNINRGGCKRVWMISGVSMYVTFLWVS